VTKNCDNRQYCHSTQTSGH